jgi:hypothetical protein
MSFDNDALLSPSLPPREVLIFAHPHYSKATQIAPHTFPSFAHRFQLEFAVSQRQAVARLLGDGSDAVYFRSTLQAGFFS